MLELAKLLRRSDVSSSLAIAVSAALVLPTPLAAAASTKAGSECTTMAATPEPSQPPRPSNAAPIRYPANDGDDPATFLTPAAVLAKFVSSKKAPLRLKSCTLERWYQSAIARYGAIYVIDARRMVYEIVTTFDRYEGHGGAWGPGTRTFVVDAAKGDGIVANTKGVRLRSNRPQIRAGRPEIR